MVTLTPRDVFRGNPPVDTHQPDPNEIVDLLDRIITMVSSGATTYQDDLAGLEAVSDPSDGDIGFVLDDGTVSNNGVYEYQTSAWVKIADLPPGFAGLDDGGVDNDKLADMATLRLKGRVTDGTGSPEDLTTDQVREMIEVDTFLARKTGAFMEVVTDVAGYAGKVVLSDGESLDVRSYRDTDAFAEVITDEAGYALSGSEAAGLALGGYEAGVLDGARIVAETGLLLSYGQSVFIGSGTTAISTSPVSGLKMFNTGSHSDPSSAASLVDHVASGSENATRGIGEAFLQFWASDAGYAFTSSFTQLVSYMGSEGGRSAIELSQGGAYFSRLEAAIDKIAALAFSGGYGVSILPLVYCQGEADTNPGMDPEAWYHSIEAGIRLPLEAYAQEAFGYPVKVVVLMTQVASHEYYGITEPVIAEQVLVMCQNDPHYVFAGAMYQYQYGDGGGVGSHLADEVEVKWAGAMVGRKAQSVARGVEPGFLNPLRAWLQGARDILIEYDVPVEPLVLDDTSVDDPGNYGFEVIRADTGASLTLNAVLVAGRRQVRLRLSADAPATDLHVRYAWSGGATSVDAGRTTGSRGCLRDSGTDTFTISATPKELWEWAPIHSFLIEYGA